MPRMIDVEAPDDWICEVRTNQSGTFSPIGWRAPDGTTEPVSRGVLGQEFYAATKAMAVAYRERLQHRLKRRLEH